MCYNNCCVLSHNQQFADGGLIVWLDKNEHIEQVSIVKDNHRSILIFTPHALLRRNASLCRVLNSEVYEKWLTMNYMYVGINQDSVLRINEWHLRIYFLYANIRTQLNETIYNFANITKTNVSKKSSSKQKC